MAATVSSAWSKPGAWALDSEEHEAELLHHNHNDAAADFPSLAVAAATKPNKKKAQTLSLAQFTAQSYQHQEEPIVLPTAPRQRTADELDRDRDRNRLGGAFRSYGVDRPHHRTAGGGDEASNSRWGSSRVSDEPGRNGSFGSRDSSRELAPSRADEIDNWAAAKKSTVGGGFENQRRERERGFFNSQSRADESDSWVSHRNFVPPEGRRERERKVGFGSSGGADSDNWNSRKVVEVNGGSHSGRPRLVLQPRSVSVSDGSQEAKAKGPNPFGSAKPREEVLAEKGQDWKKIDELLGSMRVKEAAVVDKNDGFGKRGSGSGNGRALLCPIIGLRGVGQGPSLNLMMLLQKVLRKSRMGLVKKLNSYELLLSVLTDKRVGMQHWISNFSWSP